MSPVGTTYETTVVRVVDGDTIRVVTRGVTEKDEENLRILALDTEESHNAGGKPVTPWGHDASDHVKGMFRPGDKLTLEFPGTEPVEECWSKYRGNYGRPLVYVYDKDGNDFQEHMIRQGYSPYFSKYGYASFTDHHRRYQAAERLAQQENLGVWDQIAVNGSEMRNYWLLGVWWDLRARIIEDYRAFKRDNPDKVFNTRLDYAALQAMAQEEQEVAIFTELRSIKRIGGENGIVSIGSIAQPFKLFLPGLDEPDGQRIVDLIRLRYAGAGDDKPGRGYAYVKGKLALYRDEPELIVTSAEQISDRPFA